MIWLVVVLAVLVAWFAIGLALALVLGRATHLADKHQREVYFNQSVVRLHAEVKPLAKRAVKFAASEDRELARH